MPNFTGACIAVLAAIVAMTHVAAIRDSYDEFGSLSVSGDQEQEHEQEQDFEKSKGEKVLYCKWRTGTVLKYRQSKTASHSKRLQLHEVGIEVTPSMRVAAIQNPSTARTYHVQLGWTLTKVNNQPVSTLEDVETYFSNFLQKPRTASAASKVSVSLSFDTTVTDVTGYEVQPVLPEGWVEEKMATSEGVQTGYFNAATGVHQVEFPEPASQATSEATDPNALEDPTGIELEEFSFDVTSDFDMRNYGFKIDENGRVEVLLLTQAMETGIARREDGKTWTLKWIGDRRVSNEKEIKNAVAAVASRVPASNGYVVESVRVAMTFLTVPATMVEAGFRSKEETLGYKTIVCHFFPNDSEHDYLMDGGFRVKGRSMNNYLEIQSDRKVKVEVLMGFPTYSTIGRISKEWTLDAIDEKWTYTVSDQAGMLQHLLASIGENKSRKIPLKFCTDLKKGCGVGYFFQDMKSWERDIMILETKKVEVEVVDKDESYVGKVETVEASKNEIVVNTDDPHAKGHRKQIFLTMPDDASRIKRIVSVKDVTPEDAALPRI